MSDSYRFGRTGFGGWLLVLVVAQVGQILIASLATLGAIVSSGTVMARGGLVLLLVEVVGNGACAVAGSRVLKLMLNRSPEFVRVMPRVWMAVCAFDVVEPGMQAVLTSGDIGRAYSGATLTACVLLVASTVVWIGYVWGSERVGNTFESAGTRYHAAA